MSKKCFECNGTGVCICICCGVDTLTGRKHGPCIVCKAREFRRRHAGILMTADPGDPKNWLRHPASDGNKGWFEYLPTKGLS